MDFYNIALIFFIALLAGLIQGCTGFGFSIVAMALLPLIMPFKYATAVTAFSSIFMVVVLVVKLRKHINFKIMVYPLIASLLTSLVGVFALTSSSDTVMRRILGLVLILMSVFLIFFSERIKILQKPSNGLIAGTLGGFLNGLFNLGGPPMVVYFLSITDDKMEYNATLQCYFALSSVFVLISHILLGNVNTEVLQYSGIAVIGIVPGMLAGFGLFKMFSLEFIRKLVYGFMVMFGLYLFIMG